MVSVTSSPRQVNEAVRACKSALASLRVPGGVLNDSVQSAKRAILNRFRGEAQTNKFWVENLSATQLECVPLKTLRCVTDFEAVLQGITANDLQQVVELFGFDEKNMLACVGVAGPTAPGPNGEWVGGAAAEENANAPVAFPHTPPGSFRSRGA